MAYINDPMLPSDYVHEFTDYFSGASAERLEEIVRSEDDLRHYSLELDVEELFSHSPRLAQKLLKYPSALLGFADEAAHAAMKQSSDELLEMDEDASPKRHVHVRVCNLPHNAGETRRTISALRSADVGSLLSISVTVVRVAGVLLREAERTYICTRCGYTFQTRSDVRSRCVFELPSVCPSDGDKRCYGTNFRQAESAVGACNDYQEVKVQEKVGSLEMGSIPRSMLAVLTDDLVESCKPGDDAIFTGLVQQRWNRNPVVDARCDLELIMEASNVTLCNQEKAHLEVTREAKAAIHEFWRSQAANPLEGRNVILRSICPEIYGMYLVKLVLAMSLIGGVAREDDSGTVVRGESHLLIVGDPGTGKSQLLKYAARLNPRSVLTTGVGTTSAGLTVSAAREPTTGEWTLDAGALVLADGGLCCIDEFDSIRENDRVTIHEAMEQQTVSVAKAGLVCTLNTKTTVFAATNPRAGRLSTNIAAGSDESDESSPVYLTIAAPLLSRFDVILTLMDPKNNEDWDRRLSSFILNGRCDAAPSPAAGNHQHRSGTTAHDGRRKDKLWSMSQLQKYIYYVKSQLEPELTPGATRVIGAYYAMERATARRSAARTTVRLLESLVRLTQAHARLMFRQRAVVQDAIFAIAALEASAVNQALLSGRSALHASFSPDAERDYLRFADLTLVKLGIERELDVMEGCRVEDRSLALQCLDDDETSPDGVNADDAEGEPSQGRPRATPPPTPDAIAEHSQQHNHIGQQEHSDDREREDENFSRENGLSVSPKAPSPAVQTQSAEQTTVEGPSPPRSLPQPPRGVEHACETTPACSDGPDHLKRGLSAGNLCPSRVRQRQSGESHLARFSAPIRSVRGRINESDVAFTSSARAAGDEADRVAEPHVRPPCTAASPTSSSVDHRGLKEQTDKENEDPWKLLTAPNDDLDDDLWT